MNLQPTLQNEFIILQPLEESDFEVLFAVASDPLVWEQHPNKNRYQKEVFENYFKGAIESGGAFLVINKQNGEVMGSSRFYDFNPEKKEILIGYTFLGRKFWGGKYNHMMKKLMLDHAFNFVDKVMFHIGSTNVRSQMAMERVGGKKIQEIQVAYFGEADTLNYVYCIEKSDWLNNK